MSEAKHIYDLYEIKNKLEQRIDEFVLTLFPHAKKQVGCYRIGDVEGNPGESLSISTKSHNIGQFYDHANNSNKGSAWKLVSIVKGMTIPASIAWLGNFLNVTPIQNFAGATKSTNYKELAKTMGTLSKECIDYAASRKISKKTLEAYGVATGPKGEFIFPHYDCDMNIGMTKHWMPDNNKNMWCNQSPIHSLFGKDVCDPNKKTDKLIIVEGQWDAMAMHEAGLSAVSIPSGVSNMNWIKEDYEYISYFDTIVVIMDNDNAGKRCASEISARLGVDRCILVTLPLKDPNDMLKANRQNEIENLIESTARGQLAEIVNACEMKDGVKDFIRGDYLSDGDPFFIPGFDITFRKHEVTLWFGYTSQGKALSLETLIPTPKGLVPIVDIHPNDWVYAPNGQPVKVIQESPIYHNHKCYEVTFNTGAKLVADAGHRWTITTKNIRTSERNQRKSKAKRIKENYNQQHKIQKNITVTTEELIRLIKEKKNPCISTCQPLAIHGTVRKLPIPPYVLGAWIGDGHSADGGFSCHDDDEQVMQEIRDYGYEVNKRTGKYSWGSKGLCSQLNAIGVLNNKHIPNDYLISHYTQRLALLQGLMDTDGHIANNDRRCEFCTIKKDLAHQVVTLCSSLGIKASLVEGDATIRGVFISKKYRVQFTTDIPVFRLQRKLELITTSKKRMHKHRQITSVVEVPSVPVKCISVDSEDHLFLCTEHHIPTHNSQAVQNQVANLAARGVMSVVASFEQPPERTFGSILMNMTGNAGIVDTDDFEAAFKYLSENVFIYKSREKANPAKLVSMFIHAHKRYGASNFVIDNVMTMDVDRGDNTAQASAIDAIRVFASSYPVHVHVVAHPRKSSEGVSSAPAIAEIQGASEWGNMPDNIITVWRDVAKHEKMAEMKANDFTEKTIQEFWESTPCGKLICRKQRATGELPMTNTWFDKETKRFMACAGKARAMYSKKPWA